MLQALQTVVMTEELLRESKIGVTVYETKKKFTSDNRVHVQSKNLITSWKKIVEKKPTVDTSVKSTATIKTEVKSEPVGEITLSTTLSSSNSNSSSSSSEAIITATTTITQKHEGDEDETDGWGIEEKYSELPQGRKKIVDVLVDQLKLSTSSADMAKFWSCQIEEAINALHNADSDKKAYTDKSRSLLFNLKRNDRLRLDIIEGGLAPAVLVQLSAHELATDEQREQRASAVKSAVLERRSDYYAENRSSILRANGIDPSKGGEFTCGRCKGNKTTHYAMQTRSADEPMTVFVSCLTCGKRWRCT